MQLSNQTRLCQDAGLSIENRIAKLTKENRIANLKVHQVYNHFKKSGIKRKTIHEIYPKKYRNLRSNNRRYLEVQDELRDAASKGHRIVYF